MDNNRNIIEKNINILEEIVVELKNICNTGITQDIGLIQKGWNNENGKKAVGICFNCQDDIIRTANTMEYIAEEMRNNNY